MTGAGHQTMSVLKRGPRVWVGVAQALTWQALTWPGARVGPQASAPWPPTTSFTSIPLSAMKRGAERQLTKDDDDERAEDVCTFFQISP